MDIQPLDAHDDEALDRWHSAYVRADTHDRPHAAPWRLPEMRADLRKPRKGESIHAWTGLVDDPGGSGAVTVGCCGMLILPLRDNVELAILRVWVPPEQRGRGHGSAMLDRLVDEARAAARIQLISEVHVPYEFAEDGRGHPDADFAYRRGWSFDMCDIVRVLTLPVDEERLERLAAHAAPHHQDYTLRQFAGAVPDDIVVEFGKLVGSLMVEAPSGEVQFEPEVLDVDRIRADEEIFTAAGRTKYTTVALDRSGVPVAYTELVVPSHDPGMIFQWGTLVHPDHRGHRLGMALKVANLRWVTGQVSDRDRLYTMNAEVNEQMVGINDALGFRPVERHVNVFRRIADTAD